MKNPLNNSLSKMFSGIESLTYISFSSKYNTENVTDFSEMFAYCSSLISINFANLNTKNALALCRLVKIIIIGKKLYII
jgi:surface protein